MLFASLMVGSLIVAAPITTVFDGFIVHDVVTVAAGIFLASVALRLRAADATFLLAVARPILIVASIPIFWMLLQALPLKHFSFGNSIWESAALALGRPIAGSISIDPGATIISLTRYLSITSIAFAAAAVTVDSKRAEWVLFALVATTTLIAVIWLVAFLGNFALFRDGNSSFSVSAIADVALGIVLAAEGALHNYEQYHGRARKQNDASAIWYRPIFGAYLAALTICSVAFLFGATIQTCVAVGGGIAVLVAAFVIRRFNLGLWGISAILSLSLFALASVIVLRPGIQEFGLALAFAPQSLASLSEATHRIIADASWAGFGSGTFAAVLSIYRYIDELTIGSVAPTGVAAMAVEMGQPFLWAGLFFVIVLIFILLRGALRRQRDSAYSTAGASCGVVVTLLAFCDVSLFSTSVLIILAVAIGMAIAQSQSRLSR